MQPVRFETLFVLMWATLFFGASVSKKAVMGASSAAAICCNVLTLGDVLPFPIRLKVLTFSPLRSASAQIDRLRSSRSSRRRWPTLTSGTTLACVLPAERIWRRVLRQGLPGTAVAYRA